MALASATPGASLPNTATFAAQGTEQDAMAEYLRAFYASTPYGTADTTPAGDTRIQNLAARADTVLARGINRTGTDGNDTLTGTPYDDIIRGGAGDDTIVNSAGNDLLFGGRSPNGANGTDTLVFNSRLADTHRHPRRRLHADRRAGGPGRVTGFERYQFTDATVVTGDGAPLVDDLFYLANYKDVLAAGQDADTHYATYGWKEGRDPNALFSTTGYLAANPTVRASGQKPLDHYDATGWKEGRDPSAAFDNELYLARNPDVKAAGIDPLKHYIEYGQGEGRQIYDAIGKTADLAVHPGFDAEYYLLSNPDVARAAIAAGGDSSVYAYQHYQTYGWKEGPQPERGVRHQGLPDRLCDVKEAGIDPLMHYDQYGWKEGRDPSKGFDSTAYLDAYTDVAKAKLDPMQHYLQLRRARGPLHLRRPPPRRRHYR